MNTICHKKLIIIGCGAAGAAAALSASVYCKDILILERNSVPAKKLAATGNGKCNFTNLRLENDDLRSDSGDPFIYINRFSNHDVIKWFANLGIPAFEKNGYCYPRSKQASSVRDVLASSIEELGIEVRYDTRVTMVEKKDGTFFLKTAEGYYTCEKLVIAAGGQAQSCFGTDGSLYYICGKLGHGCIAPRPALCGLKTGDGDISMLNGVRQESLISLCRPDTGETLFSEYGEIIFSKTGISGIPVMNCSRYFSGSAATLRLDFYPEMSLEDLTSFLYDNYERRTTDIAKCLTGVLNDSLISFILKKCGLKSDHNKRGQEDREIFSRIAGMMKEMTFAITDTSGFANAQTTAGGIPLSELDPVTLESLKCPGLYICGELADVDGKCGGYNLQWAWSSGVIAGAYGGGGEFDKNKFLKA